MSSTNKVSAAKEAKIELAGELQKELLDAKLLVVTTQSGLTVSEANDLRTNMRKSGATFKVLKKTVLCKALEGSEKFNDKNLISLIEGSKLPLAIAYSADEVSAAKAAFEFAKKNDKFQLQGGAHADKFYDQKEISTLATLPSLDELRSKLIAVINAPATKLAILLKEPAARIARVTAARGGQ